MSPIAVDVRRPVENETSIWCLSEDLFRVIFVKIKSVCFQASRTHYGTFCIYSALMSVSRDWSRIISSMQLFKPEHDGEDECDGSPIEPGSVGDDVIAFAREFVSCDPEADFDQIDGNGLWNEDPEEDYHELVVKAEITQSTTKPGHKVLFIVREIITTERNYIKRLRLVNKDFREAFDVINIQKSLVPKQLVNTMFSNIDSIYRLHLQMIKDLREPEDASDCNVGQVCGYFAPYFKLYSTYISNVETTTRLIDKLSKDTDFDRFIEDFRNHPECGRRHISDIMREPIMRLPKYELLLKDYLKNLPAKSNDREPAARALAAVHEAASHANEYLRKRDYDERLAELANQLHGLVDLVKPGRFWIRDTEEGPPVSVIYLNDNARPVKYRRVYLFNDLLLLREVGSKAVSDEMDLRSAKIKDLGEQQGSFALRIVTDKRAVELHFSDKDDKTDWFKEIRRSLMELASARHTILRSQTALAESIAADGNELSDADSYTHTDILSRLTTAEQRFKIERDELGIMTPVWVKDSECSQCAVCSSEFTALRRRRHHCRACGCLVCGACSRGRLLLAFIPYRPTRVCDNCFLILEHKERRCTRFMRRNGQEQQTDDLPLLDDSLLTISNTPLYVGVKGTGLSLEQGYLSGSRDKETWKRRWHSVHRNGIFYTFNDPLDSSAASAMLLHEYQLCVSGDGLHSPANTECFSFALIHRRHGQVFFYNAETKEQFCGLCRSLCDFVELSKDDVSTVVPNDGSSVFNAIAEIIGSLVQSDE